MPPGRGPSKVALIRTAGSPTAVRAQSPSHPGLHRRRFGLTMSDRGRGLSSTVSVGENAKRRRGETHVPHRPRCRSSARLQPRRLPSQPVGDRVAVNGMQMYYEVSGEGDPLIVLHGAYMNIPTMGAIIPKLAETHKVYALELQGHGRTTDIDRPITYPNLADDVAAFMDAVGLEKADVFGYSMGAVAGLQLAIRHPEKVNKLVLASGAYDAEGWQPEFLATSSRR